MDARLHIERLEYVRLGESLAVVRLLAGLGSERLPPPGASLVSQHGLQTTTYPARGCRIERARRPRLLGGELLWRAYFAVPLDVVEYPEARFELTAPGHRTFALPAPQLRVLTVQGVTTGRSNSLPVRLAGRRLVVVATTLAITGSTPAFALAATGAHHPGTGTGGSAASRGARVSLSLRGLDSLRTSRGNPTASIAPPSVPSRSGGASTAPVAGKSPDAGKSPVAGKTPVAGKSSNAGKTPVTGKTPNSGKRHLVGEKRRSGKASRRRHHRKSAGHAAHPTPAPLYGLVPTRASTLDQPPADTGSGAHKRHHPAHHGDSTESPSGGASIGSPRSHRSVRPAVHTPPRTEETPTATPAPAAVSPVLTSSVANTGLGSSAAAATAWVRLSKLLASGNRPPSFLIPIYRAAGRRYHVPWSVLAAINSIESDYGRNMSTSSAGAIGWMQFMPSTWAAYGVAAGRHTTPNPYDPRDAIFSAARYLAANGAAHNLRKAIFAYNHATWYVDEVLWTASSIADHAPARGSRAHAKLEAMRTMALALDGEPYIWGGGHGGWQLQPGYDCSGFVSTVLHAGGYLDAPQSTQTLPTQPDIRPGPGRYVTIFDRTNGGAADADHVIIDLNGRWWESGGSSGAGGASSVHRITSVSASYLLSFNEILHPRGL